MKHLVLISILLISITVMIYLIKRNKKETFNNENDQKILQNCFPEPVLKINQL